ncbi:cytochrome P450 [Podospora aff. communis PSN243]|uniref:Cytochrome P450 n=1 Tax=Podospora aff. communis PSN243 TaxID=3040156 RepID=A0AAV9GI60_9PEZI|nr:cytochrome P450 [Podospora aff. communis PSN243]
MSTCWHKPLKDIPYNPNAAKRLMGDLTELMEWKAKGKLRYWFLTLAHRHHSPISQVFLGPFNKPAIVISDYREVSDILSRRDGLHFKRGIKVDSFKGIIPHSFSAMETFDPRFKPNREMAKGLMAPSWLFNTNSRYIYRGALDIVRIWRTNPQLEPRSSRDVANDIKSFAFATIWAAAFGFPLGGFDESESSKSLITIADDESRTQESDRRAARTQWPEEFQSLNILADALAKSFYSPFPRLYHAINNLRPAVRNAWRTMGKHTSSYNIHTDPNTVSSARNALYQQEHRIAEKEGRKFDPEDPRSYLLAGYDTTAGAIIWCVRHLFAHPDWQDRIRKDLYATYPKAHHEDRLPDYAEIQAERSSLLDAFIEEVLRLTTPVITVMLETRYDTKVLGYHIPANTKVFCNLCQSSQAYVGHMKKESWVHDEPELFKPERWLVKDADDKTRFDPAAGPMLGFSAGNRGCWGQRLAYLEIRIFLAVVLWELKLEGVKEQSWDLYESLVTAPKNTASVIPQSNDHFVLFDNWPY